MVHVERAKQNLAPFIAFIAIVNLYFGLRLTVSHRDIFTPLHSVPNFGAGETNTSIKRVEYNISNGLIMNSSSVLHVLNSVGSEVNSHLNITKDSGLSPPVNRLTPVSWKDHPVVNQYLDTFALEALDKTPPQFIEGLQSHCFVIKDGSRTHTHDVKGKKVTTKVQPKQKTTLKRQYLIGDQPSFSGLPSIHSNALHCLPPFYFIGFTKCGTTDFYGHFIQHQHVIAPVFKEPRFWDENRPISVQKRSLEYMTRNYETLAAVIESCYFGNDSNICQGIFKSQAWDVDIQLNLDAIYQEIQEYKRQGRPCPLVTVDASTTYVSNSYQWENDPRNKGFHYPHVLVPHRIHHVQPNAKFVILLRNPITRLFSDFNFFVYGKNRTPKVFHKIVVGGITWWNECVQKYSEEACAYAYHLPNITSLPDGMFSLGETPADKFNCAGRLRQGIYSIFISKWYEVFPKEQILTIKFEEYRSNSIDILKSNVYPFLDMAQLNVKGESKMKELKQRGQLNKRRGTPQKMLAETEELLKNFYRPYNEKLAKLLSDNKYLWQDDKI